MSKICINKTRNYKDILFLDTRSRFQLLLLSCVAFVPNETFWVNPHQVLQSKLFLELFHLFNNTICFITWFN